MEDRIPDALVCRLRWAAADPVAPRRQRHQFHNQPAFPTPAALLMIAPIQPPPPTDPRVPLAAERTLLAWIRTAVALMGLGFVVARFGIFLHEIEAARAGALQGQSTGWSLWIGTGLIAVGVSVALLVSWEQIRLLNRFRLLDPDMTRTWRLTIPVSAALALLGMAMCVSLLRSGLAVL